MADYKIGDDFAREWNRVRSKVDGQLNQSGGNSGTDGQQHPPFVPLKIIAPVEDGGTGRYTAKTFYGTKNNAPTNLQESDIGTVSSNLVEVWNTAAINGGGTLSANAIVFGFLFSFNKDTGMPVYAVLSVGSSLTVYITSNTGTASYQGNIQQGSATNITGTGLTNDGAEVLLYNLCEVGSTAASPFLANGSIAIGTVKGTDADSGMLIVWTSQLIGYVCTSDSGG